VPVPVPAAWVNTSCSPPPVPQRTRSHNHSSLMFSVIRSHPQAQADVPVSDAGMAHLAGLSQLSRLDLSGRTAVTADGLAHLRTFVRLQHLCATSVEAMLLPPHLSLMPAA